MNENYEMIQQNNQEILQAPTLAQMQQAQIRDPRSLGQYAIDKTFDVAGRELDRMEQEKPGTRRKLAGIVSMAVGIGGIGTGIYLLAS